MFPSEVREEGDQEEGLEEGREEGRGSGEGRQEELGDEGFGGEARRGHEEGGTRSGTIRTGGTALASQYAVSAFAIVVAHAYSAQGEFPEVRTCDSQAAAVWSSVCFSLAKRTGTHG